MMRSSENYNNLIAYAPNEYIGFGNPNAKILVLSVEEIVSQQDQSPISSYKDVEIEKIKKLMRKIMGDNVKGETDINSQMFHTVMAVVDASETFDPLYHLRKSFSLSVLHRVGILSTDFFRNFKVIIAPVGDCPRQKYGDEYFPDIFDTKFCGNVEQERYKWLNVNVREDEKHPLLLLHFRQLSDKEVDNPFISQFADIIMEYTNRHKIDLLSNN